MRDKFNYSLLPYVVILYEERSTVKAAMRLGVSQSLVSKSIKRLSEYYSRPLFHREGQIMVPTGFTESIYPKLRSGLKDLDSLKVDLKRYNPQKVATKFNIGVAPGLNLNLASYFANLIEREALAMCVNFKLVESTDAERLLSQEQIDVMVDLSSPIYGMLSQDILYYEQPVLLLSGMSNKFLEHTSIELSDLSDQLLIGFSRPAMVDGGIELPGLTFQLIQRVIADGVSVEDGCRAIEETGCMGVALSRTASRYVLGLGLRVLSIKGAQDIPIMMYTHKRMKGAAHIKWLKEKMVSAIKLSC
ncbi:LysR family transcriptional regulator [Vibrio sp. SCSIO 43135]|uniref:LysR family transcriptional regulator n=1 Tax=Vibrio sp. SCSIO 43135 TaxID=2819096 RepID=UPI0020750804|nr:LysR family transcriptional regulator [Vibrio sp. SCSIO 43135]USD42362.1 LysR family transcriptional regulator [Vibrio sp. SCSIO 43135]